jgi:hypothetical protein
MKLNLGLIAELLGKRYDHLVCDPIDRMSFDGVAPCRAGAGTDEPGRLLLVDWDSLQRMEPPVKNAVCIGGGDAARAFFEEHAMQGFIFPASCSPLSLLYDFQEIFARFSELEVKLLSAICEDAPTRRLLNCTADFFQCHMMLFDNDFRLIEYSDNYLPSNEKVWKETFEKKRSIVPRVTRDQVAMRPSRPNEYPHSSYLELDSMPTHFNAGFDSDGAYFATLIFMQVARKLSPVWNWLVDYVSDILKPVIAERYNTRLDLRNQLRGCLRSTLLHKNMDYILLDGIFPKCGWMEFDFYRLILVHLPKESTGGLIHYQYNYENIFANHYADVIALTCDDFIVILLHNDACDLNEDALGTLDKQLRLDGGVCSIGLKFCGMREIAAQYLFTIIPFNLYDDGGGRIRYYRNIMPEHLVMEVNSVIDLASICHWAAVKLYYYDCENNTAFLQTLETYLLCNKSLNDAANLLFIHKSTIYYRMKCIGKIVQIDLDDPHERFSILLSCIALREMSKFKNADRKTPRRDAHPASDAGAP